MTRYTDEWLDAKMANIQRWKREEAARSAAKQSTSGGVESRHAQRRECGGIAPVEPTPLAGVAPGPLTSTAGAASPAGVPSTLVAAPAPINATKADAQLTDAPGATRSHDGAAARRQPRDGVSAASSGPNKYRNRPTDGYASKREAKRAAALRLMQEAGQIRDLREQVEFLLIPRQTRPDGTAERSCSYWADFVYDEWTADGWRRVVEDVKGVRTPDYVIKRKLMLFVHGVAIREV